MIFEHIGLNQINGSLVVLDGVKGASYEEMVELRLEDGTSRAGRIVKIDGELVVIQVFEGTRGISMNNQHHRALRQTHGDTAVARDTRRVFDGSADR